MLVGVAVDWWLDWGEGLAVVGVSVDLVVAVFVRVEVERLVRSVEEYQLLF